MQVYIAVIGGTMPVFSMGPVIGGVETGGQAPNPSFGTYPQLRIYFRNLEADVRATCVIALP